MRELAEDVVGEGRKQVFGFRIIFHAFRILAYRALFGFSFFTAFGWAMDSPSRSQRNS